MTREIIGRKPYSSNPGDHYLEIVLAKFNNEFVTWVYNKESDGYAHGHYFQDSMTKALADFNERGSE